MRLLKSRFTRKNRNSSETIFSVSKELDKTGDEFYISPQRSLSAYAVTNKPKSEAAINAIYTRAGLKLPLIIWTKSPMENVFAKASIDCFSEKNLTTPWGFRQLCHVN